MTRLTRRITRSLVDTSLGQMMVRTSGTPDAAQPSVVLIHHMGSSGRMWKKVMESFGDVHCIAPDIPGIGDSDTPPCALDVPGYAEAVFETVRPSIGEAGCILVGQHAGSVYAAHLAARYPELVKGVLCIAFGMYDDWAQGQLGFYSVGLQTYTLEGGGLRETWDSVGGNLPPDVDVQTRVDCFTDRLRGGPNYFAPYLSAYTVDRDAILERLMRSGVPAIMMDPIDDPIMTPTALRKHREIMHAEPRRPAAGIWISLFSPEIICDAVRELRMPPTALPANGARP